MNHTEDGAATVQKEASGARLFRRASVVVLSLFIVTTAFYVFEDWRGNRLWNNYRQELAAQGISLEPPLPSQATIRGNKDSRTPYEIEFSEAGRVVELAASLVDEGSSSSPHRGFQYVDLAAWKEALDLIKLGNTNKYRTVGLVKSGELNVKTDNTDATARAAAAAEVLDAFAGQNVLLDKLRSACRRPELIYPFGYDSSSTSHPIPIVFTAINLCRELRVRTSAELAAGEAAEALRNLDLMLCISDSLGREPWLIGSIGSVACRTIALRSVWEGLAERRFSEPQLQQLEQLLRSEDALGDIPRVLRYERAQTLQFFEGLRNERNFELFLPTPPSGSLGETLKFKAFTFTLSSIPDGWVKLDELNYSRRMDEIIAASLASPPKRIPPTALDQACEKVQRQLAHRMDFRTLFSHSLISSLAMPKVNEWELNSTAAQVTTDQIRLACGLERYFLKHNNYPEVLDQIVPEFLVKMPADPISGESYRYARDQNGRYKVWSVGWNEKDDGGVPGATYDKTADWVWHY